MKLTVIKDDITRLSVDAIVNAANSGLMGGGGVDGAIHRAGGPSILEACKAIVRKKGNCPVGEAVVTDGGNLKVRYVIHTVGPVWHGGNDQEDDLLINAYQNCLMLAADLEIRVMAFPNISTGIYRFPKQRAARLAVHTVKSFSSESKALEEVIFCCFDDENYKIYNTLI